MTLTLVDFPTHAIPVHSLVDFETIEGVPTSLVTAYAAAATDHAVVREIEEGLWVATVAGLDGVYAEAEARGAALIALPEVIIGWVAVRLRAGANDIPAIDGFDVNLRTRE